MNRGWRSLLIIGVILLANNVSAKTSIEIGERVLTAVVCFTWLHSVVQACVFNVLHLVAPGRIIHPGRVVKESVGLVLYGFVMWMTWPDDSVVQALIYASYRPVASIVITDVFVKTMRNTFGLAAWYGDYRMEVLRVVVVLEMYVCVVMTYPYAHQGFMFAMDMCVEKYKKFFHG